MTMQDAIEKAAMAAAPAASQDGGWPELPPETSLPLLDYPLHALPDSIRAAVEEVQGFTKAPPALVASSALGAVSLAVQALVDVERTRGLSGPVGLFLLTVADSGERKSTCDKYFSAGIREYQDEQAQRGKQEFGRYRAAMARWEEERKALVRTLSLAAEKAAEIEVKERELAMLETAEPVAPRVPKLLRGDDTPENLAWSMSQEWPSGGIITAEAGVIFGAQAMGKDSVMRHLSQLNILWDGGSLMIGRKTSGSFELKGARLTISLQVQEATLRSFYSASAGLARGMGFLARFLIACPESTQGTRFFTEAPADWLALAAFNKRLKTVLEEEVPIRDGHLHPTLVPLSDQAKVAWIAVHDTIEQELGDAGQLSPIRDVASKAADNVARLAALFHVFESGVEGSITLENVERAAAIVMWHLFEAKRFLGLMDKQAGSIGAERLLDWMVKQCKIHGMKSLNRREIQQKTHPKLRKQEALMPALKELEDTHRVRQVGNMIWIHPALLED